MKLCKTRIGGAYGVEGNGKRTAFLGAFGFFGVIDDGLVILEKIKDQPWFYCGDQSG